MPHALAFHTNALAPHTTHASLWIFSRFCFPQHFLFSARVLIPRAHLSHSNGHHHNHCARVLSHFRMCRRILPSSVVLCCYVRGHKSVTTKNGCYLSQKINFSGSQMAVFTRNSLCLLCRTFADPNIGGRGQEYENKGMKNHFRVSWCWWFTVVHTTFELPLPHSTGPMEVCRSSSSVAVNYRAKGGKLRNNIATSLPNP